MTRNENLTADVLGFWLGDCRLPEALGDARVDLWFRAKPQGDWEVARRFSRAVEQALAGDLAGLAETPRGRLASIILLDQFPRHLYRHTPRAFAGDAAAVALTKDGMRRGHDSGLYPSERLFFYGPLEHSENLEDQAQGDTNFQRFMAEVPPPVAERLAYFYHWIQVHRDVALRFGRFPWRNRILGRRSTTAELAYLDNNPPYFGQW